MNIVLTNGNEYEVSQETSPYCIVIKTDDIQVIKKFSDDYTSDNLASFKYVENGATLGEYEDYSPTTYSVSVDIKEDKPQYTGLFNIVELDPLQKQIKKMKESETMMLETIDMLLMSFVENTQPNNEDLVVGEETSGDVDDKKTTEDSNENPSETVGNEEDTSNEEENKEDTTTESEE